ncbi:MAG: response regulator [Rhodocyclaceae bacterium]|nr:response regulator [Rhodocyclaceae bacterium]
MLPANRAWARPFSFWLPLELRPPRDRSRRYTSRTYPPAEHSLRRRRRHQPDHHSRTVEKWATIEIAEDGQRPSRGAGATRDYDMVLMDSRMPRMNGIEALRLIRDGEGGAMRRFPVVALTANIGPEERERFFRPGSVAFSAAHRRAPAALKSDA